MATELKLPELADSGELTVGRWLKAAGEPIVAREKLLEVHSAQYDWDIPAPSDGTLETIRADAGARVHAGDVLALLGGQAAANGETAAAADEPPAPTSQRVSPIAARIAAAHAIDLAQVQGTGPGGRITKEDVLALTQSARQTAASSAPLAASAVRAPHVTTFLQVDLSRVAARRAAMQRDWQQREGFALDELPFIVQACAAAIRAVPIVNSVFDAQGIRLKKQIHLRLRLPAADTTRVALVRDADGYNLVGLARRIARARQESAPPAPDALQAATFTIHHHGAGGSLFATTLLDPAQTAALGVGVVQPRAVAVEDRLQIRPIVYLSLTYDHRVVDGIVAGQFLSALKHSLENHTLA